jgi:hypothetical protein
MLVPWTWDQALDGLLASPPAFLVCWQDAECQASACDIDLSRTRPLIMTLVLSGILSLRLYARTLLPRHIFAAVDIARGTCGRTQWTSDDHYDLAHDFLWQLCMACYDVYLKGDVRVMHAPLHRIRLSDLNRLDKRRALDLTVEVASMNWTHLNGVSWLNRARGGWDWKKGLSPFISGQDVFNTCWANPDLHSGEGFPLYRDKKTHVATNSASDVVQVRPLIHSFTRSGQNCPSHAPRTRLSPAAPSARAG